MLAKERTFVARAEAVGLAVGASYTNIGASRDGSSGRLGRHALAAGTIAVNQLILTLNAGTSSVKFAAFAREAAGLKALASGQIEGLNAVATFQAEMATGEKSSIRARREPRPGGSSRRAASDREVGDGEPLGSRHRRRRPSHRPWRSRFLRTHPDRRRRPREAAPIHPARAAASAAQPRRRRGGAGSVPARRRRSPASTPRFTAATRSSPTPSRCRARITTRACGATAFTASPTNSSSRRLRTVAPACRRRAGDRRPSRQRRLDVRDARRPLRRLDHGLHRDRRVADGHPLRPDRSRRHLYLIAEKGMSASAVSDLL